MKLGRNGGNLGHHMRIAISILVILFVWLQYKLWFTDGGLVELWDSREAVAEQKSSNQQITEKNQALSAEVDDLKLGVAALEERARNELGMIKEDELFFQVVDSEKIDVNHSSQ